MFTRFVVCSHRSGTVYWGSGDTLEVAHKRHKSSGGRTSSRNGNTCWGFRAESEMPFAPHDREANDDEADFYVSGGYTNSLRCRYVKIDPKSGEWGDEQWNEMQPYTLAAIAELRERASVPCEEPAKG